MHLKPVLPGLRPDTLNMAAVLSSSVIATWPADQELGLFEVVAENAASDARHTIVPLPRTASRTTISLTPVPNNGRDGAACRAISTLPGDPRGPAATPAQSSG